MHLERLWKYEIRCSVYLSIQERFKTCEKTTEVLWKYRPIIKEKVEREDDRRKIFEQLLSLCLSGLEPDEKTVENLIEEYEQ